MSAGRDEGPIYYREIQKNAYLKRIPNESTSKLLPLGHKKPPLKAMWTLFCVHNGRTPFLEQYPEPESPSTLAHKPVWRACLRSARHVTCSVSPAHGSEYDFLIDTEHGPVRMLAPDWDSMQDWVSTLRSKLHELKIVPRGENMYCGAPAPPPARAAARDPTSPLPAPPPHPPHRVPGIELTIPTTRQTQITQQTQPNQPPQINPPLNPPNPPEPTPEPQQPQRTEDIDISNWEPNSIPSTSQSDEPKTSVAKICGQNICLDDSILKRNFESQTTTDSDEEFFAEIDRISDSVENLNCDANSASNAVDDNVNSKVNHKSRVVVNNEKVQEDMVTGNGHCDRPTNITVIQVSNKPPHTAIPVLGPQIDIFNFDFKQNVPVTDNNDRFVNMSDSNDRCVNDSENNDRFVNIVNTEVNVNSENGYGTVFTKESDYGHISLTTTVSLTGDVKTDKADNDGIYERLCLASTSTDNRSPIASRKVEGLRCPDKVRKSSLPNLDADSTYEYLFPNNNKNTTVTLNMEPTSLILPVEVNSNDSRVTRLHNSSEERVSNTNASENRGVHVVTSTVTVTDHNTRLRNNVERSLSQNAYDRSPRRDVRRVQNNSPIREVKIEKAEAQPKPIWRRGLTELSLLSKLRGIGQGKRQDSPSRKNNECSDRGVTSPGKVVHRSRADARADPSRRRSSSLSNGGGAVLGALPPPPPLAALVPLRARQAAWLRAEQRRGAAIPHSQPANDTPLFADYNRQVWIACWGGAGGGATADGRAGDRVVGVRGVAPRDAAHATQLFKSAHAHSLAAKVNILFHRVPLAKIYVISKRDLEPLGLRLDGQGVVTGAEAGGPAHRAALPPPGLWALTEINNRPLLHAKGIEEDMNRLSLHGTEVSILLQPAPLVKKLRAATKRSRPLLARR